MVAKFLGELNFALGYRERVKLNPTEGKRELTILSTEGISPIGVGLHDPVLTCIPLERVFPTQKLIKLFLAGCKLQVLPPKTKQ